MPWFPDFVGAAELVRLQTRAAGQTDPVAQYLTALAHGDARPLEDAWPGRVVIKDPRAGEVRGHRKLRQYIRRNQAWLQGRAARTERVAVTSQGGRAVMELMAYLSDANEAVAWPVAVVADSPDSLSIEFRIYCSQRPVDGSHHIRPPVLRPETLQRADAAARYFAALEAGSVDTLVEMFSPDGYLREAAGPQYTHRGEQELRSYFTECFSAGGGIRLSSCAVTHDRLRRAVEFTCVRWGSHDLPPQPGVAVLEERADGRLAAVRFYDDVQAPVGVDP